MDQLLVHQLLSILPRIHRVDDADQEELAQKATQLLDRILSGKMKDARISLGTLLINSIKFKCHDIGHTLLDYLEVNPEMAALRSIVVNYLLPGANTSLHYAASSTDPSLVVRLLTLEANPWQTTIRGELPFHQALREYESHSHSDSSREVIYANLELLAAAMLANCAREDIRLNGLVQRLIDSSDVSTLPLLQAFNSNSDGATNCFFLEHALQSRSTSSEVIDYLLNEVNTTWTATGASTVSIPVSPLDLALDSGNLRAAVKALDLGFELSRNYFRKGCQAFRHVLVPEEDIDDFPKARRLFDYLLARVATALELTEDQVKLRRNQKVLKSFTTTSVRYFAQAESFINNQHRTYAIKQSGNFLTYSLMNHCGYMARRLIEFPVRFPPLEMKALQYYQFSHWDIEVVKDLFTAGLVKMIDFINFHPRYIPLSRVNVPTISDRLRDLVLAHETEENREQVDYLRFLEWYDNYHRTCLAPTRSPPPLSITCRNYLIGYYLAFDVRTDTLEQFADHLARREVFRKSLPRPLFEYLFESLNLVKY